MTVTLLTYTPQPEKTVACAAKLCYSASGVDQLYEGLTNEKASDFVQMLAEIGHESPIEHASFTFALEGVSRSLLAQITRHRLASFSVQSQRYVKESDFSFVTPPEIAADPAAHEVFLKSMERAVEDYNTLADLLQKRHEQSFLDAGLPEKEAKRKAEKKAIEDARFVLPNACATKMILTMNARSLLNFFQLRCCNRAQWEIKAVADEMLRQVCAVAPTLFAAAGPSCYHGSCSEGKMSCQKAAQVRAFYTMLHNRQTPEP